jgi:hypothetical protein
MIIEADECDNGSTNVITSLKSEGHSVFYFYFDTRDQSKAKITYKGLLSSLMLDIGLQVDQAELKSLYEKYNTGRTQMPTDAMQATAIKLLEKMSAPAYIVIDAMDECEGHEQPLVTAFIRKLLQSPSRINIFATCRYPAANIGINSAAYQISLQDTELISDIDKHVQKALQEKSLFVDIQEEVRGALVNGAHGQ